MDHNDLGYEKILNNSYGARIKMCDIISAKNYDPSKRKFGEENFKTCLRILQ